MGIIAGIDEAGYGPLLGPLVVSLAAFHIPDPVATDDPTAAPPSLWGRLGSQTVRKSPPSGRKAKAQDRRLVVCDSKKLYAGGRGLDRVEESVLCFLASARGAPLGRVTTSGPQEALRDAALGGSSANTLLARLGVPPVGSEACPWFDGRDPELPLVCFQAQLEARHESLTRALERSGTRTLHLAPAVLHPRALNRGVRRHGNKHRYEWSVVARFLEVMWERYADEGVDVTVDKLSGRSFYGPPLAKRFPGAQVVAEAQGSARSQYLVRRGGKRLRVRFCKKADDTAFATALASLSSKYFREVYMRPLNGFFADRVPGLRPTAGYAQDGKRFLREIEGALSEIDVDRDALVRCC
jgi:hypothetical protein